MGHFRYLCLMFVMLSCLFIAAFLPPAGKYLLALLCMYVVLYCVYVTFSFGGSDQVWCLILSIPELCILPNF